MKADQAMTISIILADDHQLFRQGLARLIQEQEGWTMAGEAADGAEAVRLVETFRPRIAVLDVEMPKLSGMEAASRIKALSPDTGIVALSMYGDPIYQKRMFDAGASAYVLKNEAIDDLVHAVDAVLRGKIYVSPQITSRAPMTGPLSAGVERHQLSEREAEVLGLLAEGFKTKEVAQKLGISHKTVETYRGRIMFKLGIDNLPDLVKLAIRAGLTALQR